MSLTGKTKASSYKDILQMNNSNNGVDTTVRTVADGEGTSSALYLSDDQIVIKPNNDDTTGVVKIQDKDGNTLFGVDSTNDLVRAGAGTHIVNTNIQQFGLSSYLALPSSSDTWTALSNPTHRLQTAVTAGTGGTPDTSVTVSSTADDMVGIMWYVPFNISIDSCNVWFGADQSSGDVVKFSVMSYTVDTSNGSTGGDLSSGVENCVSPGAITGAGREQAYYQALTISTADVDAGKTICAFVSQDGTSSDLSCNMQLIWHCR